MKAFFNNITRMLIVGILLLSLAPISSFSQKWVSKNVQKRNVLLEEFTGIHCVYCPDGHKRATDLKNANPGRVVLVNIHAGSYAVPGAGEVDLRTTVSTAVDRSSGLSGYPAGSVNRSTNPWAMSRDQWASVIPGILNQNSPVNIAVRSEYDALLKKIRTEVEIYYTGDPQAGDKLNLYFLQDSILGTQTGGTTWFPTNFVDGQYVHNHVLRMSMEVNPWGLFIKGAVKGQVITKTFINDVPSVIGNIAPVMTQFKVVAFVVPYNNNNVYTAVEEKVTTGVIESQSLVDLELTDKTAYPTGLKMAPMTPQVEVNNKSNKEITGFDLYFEFNGTTIVKTFAGSLQAGAKTTVAWDDVTPKGGANSINFKGVYDISNNYFDATSNKINEVYKGFLQFKEKAFTETNVGFDGSYPEFVYLDQSQNPLIFMQNSNNPFLGAKGTTGAVWFILDNQYGQLAGKAGNIMLGECDLTTSSTASLSYYYAYSDGNKGGSAPTIRVEASTDWGVTWNVINTTTCVQTGQVASGYDWYLPKSSEYKLVTVDLVDYVKKGILLRVAGVPGSNGNCMFIDEISVTSSAVAEGPKISVDTKTVIFGTVDTDKSKDMEVTLTNTGDETLTIYSILKQGDNINAFTLTSGSDTKSILKGGTAKIGIRFQPMAGADYSGTIAISTNAKNETSTNISLSGKGNPAGSVAYGVTPNGELSMTMTPNPVVESSQFNYTISGDANCNVRIYVMDITGKVVSELVNSSLSAGTYHINFSSEKFVSGTYFIMADVDGSQAQIPVVIAK